MNDASARVSGWLAELGLEAGRRGERLWSLRIPCAMRGAVAVSLECRERTLSLRAFVMRRPDRREDEVHRRLLRRHLDMRVWRFAVDDSGDLWLVADLPLEGLDADGLDGLLGLLSTTVDETYDGVLRTGFDVPPGTPTGPPPGGGG